MSRSCSTEAGGTAPRLNTKGTKIQGMHSADSSGQLQANAAANSGPPDETPEQEPESQPDLVEVLRSAARLQSLVPASILVHPSPTHIQGHVLAELRENFEVVLDAVESGSSWAANQPNSGKIILGELGGVETGLRYRRGTPADPHPTGGREGVPALKFRNLTVSPDDPVEEWGFEGLLAAVERGDRTHWQRIARALVDDNPRGKVAGEMAEVLEMVESPAMVELFTRVLRQAALRREQADHTRNVEH